MTYKEALDYIHSLGRFRESGMSGPERMRRLCSLLGSPQDRLRFVHVAGTNGKGSVTAMLSSVLSASGYTVGRYISPFIYRFNERISINGTDISDADIARLCGQVRDASETLALEGERPVEFEFITAMAFLYFFEKGCDISVLETGLGGRLDATNVISTPEVCVLTVIDYDHMVQLGNTLQEIAAEKCGIIKSGVPVVSYPLQLEEAAAVIRDSAERLDSPLIIPSVRELEHVSGSLEGERFRYKGEDYRTSLTGGHQVYNASCVIEAVEVLRGKGYSIPPEALRRGMAGAYFPARFEILSRSPLIIFDGAHNMSGIRSLTDAVSSLLGGKRLHYICGMLADKNPTQAVDYIVSRTQPVSFTAVPVDNPRAASPALLAEAAGRTCPNIRVCDDVRGALKALSGLGQDDALVCFGSLFLASGVRGAVEELYGIRSPRV
ncbi:MAG: folylpolyglutamate synthase/dihydrofolate synthase family protein [Eubacteriales bacterium]